MTSQGVFIPNVILTPTLTLTLTLTQTPTLPLTLTPDPNLTRTLHHYKSLADDLSDDLGCTYDW